MKKLLCFVMALFISFAAFSVDYGIRRFPWDKSYDEILSYFVANEWSMRVDKDTKTLRFTPSDNYFYQNKLLKVKEFFFTFNSDGSIQTQNIILDNDYSIAVAYMALLTAAINDSATFYDQDYNNDNGLDNLSYNAHLPDCNLYTIITGKDDYYMVVLSYNRLD